MKSEGPALSLTIARLVRSVTPVTPLEPPALRLARWSIGATVLAFLSVAILGVRADVGAHMLNGWFVVRGTATLAIVVAAAIMAFSTSVPGVQPSRLVRALPLAAWLTWALVLAGTLAATRSPLDVLLRVSSHPSCVLLIVAAGLLPGVTLVRMLRDAAPLQARWTAGFAGLASFALGALAAQFVCSNDAAAHHLLWHFTPVALLTMASAATGSLLLDRSHRRPL